MAGIVRLVVGSLICSCVVLHASAQSVIRSTDTVKKSASHVLPPKPKGPKPITKEMSVGLRLNTDGWSAFVDYGKVKSQDPKHSDMFYKVRFWQLEFTEKKNPREEKSTSENSNSSGGNSTYIYGKINNFYAFKLGYGFRKLIVGKPDPGTVSIHWANVIGLSVGLLKPYYLNVYSDPAAIKYSPDTAPYFLDNQIIEGSAGFSKGLSEIKVIPGIHFKSSLHFDFSTNRKNVIALETGVNAEYYSQSIALMANQSATNYFLDLFLAFQFGRRW